MNILLKVSKDSYVPAKLDGDSIVIEAADYVKVTNLLVEYATSMFVCRPTIGAEYIRDTKWNRKRYCSKFLQDENISLVTVRG